MRGHEAQTYMTMGVMYLPLSGGDKDPAQCEK